jgi:hypothetical protein
MGSWLWQAAPFYYAASLARAAQELRAALVIPCWVAGGTKNIYDDLSNTSFKTYN